MQNLFTFFNKNIGIFQTNIYKTLTDDVVGFEQWVPDRSVIMMSVLCDTT